MRCPGAQHSREAPPYSLCCKCFPRGQAEQRVECGKDIVEHYPKSPTQRPVIVTDGRRFDYIEHPEQEKSKGLPHYIVRSKQQHQAKGSNLIPDHAAVIMFSQGPACNSACPHPGNKHCAYVHQQGVRRKEVVEHPEQWERSRGCDGSGRDPAETDTAAEGNEVCGMAPHERPVDPARAADVRRRYLWQCALRRWPRQLDCLLRRTGRISGRTRGQGVAAIPCESGHSPSSAE